MKEPIYIACDDKDSQLGHFFKSCSDTIKQAATDNNKDYEEINSSRLNKETINEYTKDAEDYVFAGFSHGQETSLLCNNIAYVEVNDNVKNFYSSVLYTFACSTAIGIGKEFTEVFVLGYFGYNAPAYVVPIYEDSFVKCATKGLVSFIEGKSLKKAKEDMTKEYDKQINDMYSINYFWASLLLSNKQSLVTIINNEELTI